MPVLVDTNVLVDVLTDDPKWADWSIEQLDVIFQRDVPNHPSLTVSVPPVILVAYMNENNLVIRLDPSDNVGVAACSLHDGQGAYCEGRPLTVIGNVPTGHKIAIEAIAAGAKVVKFAAPIGSATRDIRPGEHVHLHNLTSDYLPTYTFDPAKAYVRRV